MTQRQSQMFFWFLIFLKKAESLRRYVNAPGKSRSSYRRASLSVCVSPIIISPSRLRSPASTPFPSTSPPSKRPLCTFPKPQAGLRSLRIAASQLNKRASFKISRAPFSYCRVTSAPSALITFPSRIYAGGRGVGSPPKASGQIGIRWCLSFNSSSMGSRQPVPSYRQSTPRRQALTSMFILGFLLILFCYFSVIDYCLLIFYQYWIIGLLNYKHSQ